MENFIIYDNSKQKQSYIRSYAGLGERPIKRIGWD